MENNESKTPKKTTTDKSTARNTPSTAKSRNASSKSTNSAKPAEIKATSSKPKMTTTTPAKSVPTTKAEIPNLTKPTATSAAKPTPTATPKTPAVSKTPGAKPQVKEIEKSNINKDLIAEDTIDDKKKKKRILLIIFFLILGLALIGVAIYFVTRIPESEIRFTIDIDAVVDATFENEYGQIEEYVYIPGDLVKGNLTIRLNNLNINDGTSVFLRFKVSVESDSNYYSGFFYPIFNKESDWYGNGAGVGEVSADNYYYYMAKVSNNLEISVFDYLDFVGNKDNNFLNGKTSILRFTVEILEGNYSAIGQEWSTAPDEWRTTVR